ncbi:MAG: hypothetical protein KDL87_07880, partial [Verrucomicrobiae bacterium]|nr:hypothetical protein [Verrucomicrobiae bacterium]
MEARLSSDTEGLVLEELDPLVRGKLRPLVGQLCERLGEAKTDRIANEGWNGTLECVLGLNGLLVFQAEEQEVISIANGTVTRWRWRDGIEEELVSEPFTGKGLLWRASERFPSSDDRGMAKIFGDENDPPPHRFPIGAAALSGPENGWSATAVTVTAHAEVSEERTRRAQMTSVEEALNRMLASLFVLESFLEMLDSVKLSSSLNLKR